MSLAQDPTQRRLASRTLIVLLALAMGLSALAVVGDAPAEHDHEFLAETQPTQADHWLADHLDVAHDGSDVDGFHGHPADGTTTPAGLPSFAMTDGLRSLSDPPPSQWTSFRATDPPADRFRPPIV